MTSGPLKILIIEDRRENIVFLANNVLKPKGYDVLTAMDGETGLRKALDEHPDLIISDLKLPRKHGLEVLAELRQLGVEIPTIVMTFHGSEDTAIEAFRLGAKDYLIKPFTIDDVEASLDRVLASLGQISGLTPSQHQTLVDENKLLARKVAELEALIDQADEADDDAETSTDELLAAEAPTTLAEAETRISALMQVLAGQAEQTREARQTARAMMQFVRKQHQWLLQNRAELARLTSQLQGISQTAQKLSDGLETQGQAFNNPSFLDG